jgi:DNA-binding transcriptional regulator YiaG
MKTKGYHYLESGLRNVWLANGFAARKTEYGEGISIADVEGLHKVIGLRLVERKPRLTGAEFRYLRKELGLSQAKLGKLWGYDAQTVAIWEKRNRVPMIADRFIRAYYLEVERGNAQIRELVERLNDIDRREDTRLIFEETRQGWRAKAA